MRARILRWILAAGWGLWAIVGAATPAGLFSPDQVGDAGDPFALEIRGCQTFTPDQIRGALLSSPAYDAVSNPFSSRAAWLAELKRELRDGYQDAGFPDPQIEVQANSTLSGAVVTIVEGPRFRSGNITLASPPTAVADELLKALRAPSAAKTAAPGLQLRGLNSYQNSKGRLVGAPEPIWTPGEPAAFDALALQDDEDSVRQALADLGYYSSQVTVRLTVRPAVNLADLEITLADAGPRGRIGSINVTGLDRNTPAQIEHWLGMAVGQEIPPNFVSGLEQQLWNSGRFRSYQVKVNPMAGTPGQLEVDLQLIECPGVPKLDEDFSQSEAWLDFRRRLLDWIQSSLDQGHDVVVTLDSRLAPALHAHALKVIFSPEGVLVAASKDGQVDGAIAASKTTLGWWSPAYGRNWVDPKNMLKPSAYVELLLNPNPADKKVANLTFGAGLSSEQGPGFQLSVTFAPGCFLYVASSGNLSLRRAGDIYEVRSTGNDRVVRFDLAHGRISVASAAHPDAPENLIVHTEPGALPQTMRDLDATSGANGFKADAHFSSFFAQAMSEIADLPSVQREYPHFFSSTTPAQRTGAIAAAQQLLSTGLAKMSDKFGQLYAGGGDDDFEIPSPQDDQPQSDQDIKKFITGLYALTAWALPPDSWSRILISQVAVMYLSSARDFRGISDWLDRVDSGPLLDLTIASLTAHTPFGMDWAQHGLGRLSGADFARDYNIVLRQPCGLHDTVLDLAAAWRDLDDAQAENLLAVLPSEEARLLRRTRADLRANPKVPIADTLAAELDEQWKDSWRVRVEATLSVIAHPPPPPATGRH